MIIKINDYMHGILTNWSRWCLSGKGQGHCMSLEHRYVEPSDLYREPKNSIEINTLEAAEIEKILCQPRFPKKQRRIIINEYVFKKDYKLTCRELGFRYAEYVNEVQKAVHIFENRITFYNSLK